MPLFIEWLSYIQIYKVCIKIQRYEKKLYKSVNYLRSWNIIKCSFAYLNQPADLC